MCLKVKIGSAQTALTTQSTGSSFTITTTSYGASALGVDVGPVSYTIRSESLYQVDGSNYRAYQEWLGGTIVAQNTTCSYNVLELSSEQSTTTTAYYKNSYTYTATECDGFQLVMIKYGNESSTETESYTFSSITETTTFTAYYNANSYTINYDSNGGSGSMSSTSAYYTVNIQLTANAFTRERYIFTGWNTETDGSGTSYEDRATVSIATTKDGETVTLYAQWAESPITITSYTGDTLEAEYVYSNDAATIYVIDATSLQLVSYSVITEPGDYYLEDYYEDWVNVGYKVVVSPAFAEGAQVCNDIDGGVGSMTQTVSMCLVASDVRDYTFSYQNCRIMG